MMYKDELIKWDCEKGISIFRYFVGMKRNKWGFFGILFYYFIIIVISVKPACGQSNLLEEYQANLKEFTLPGGLRIYLFSDTSANGIYANWIVKVGKKHDPPNLPGMSEVLRRMIQTGNDTIGTLNFKREKIPLQRLQQINDEWAKTSNKTEKESLLKEMVRLSNVAADYAVPSEMDRLIQSMGAKTVINETDFESTIFFSHIPSHLIEGWLLIVKEQMKTPSFRMYLHEKEKYFRELAIKDYSKESSVHDSLISFIFKKSGYGLAPVASFSASDAFPTVNQLMEFHKKYYIPTNSALILVGNFNLEYVERVLAENFIDNDSDSVKVGSFAVYKQPSFKSKQVLTVNLGSEDYNRMTFTAPGASHEDQASILLLKLILSNTGHNGILDTLVRERKLADIKVQTDLLNDFSTINIYFRPLLGSSVKTGEELIKTVLDSLKKGRFHDTLLKEAKNKATALFLRELEYPAHKCSTFSEWFITGRSISDMLNYPDKWMKIEKKDIIKVANKFITDKYFLFNVKPFLDKKNKKLADRELPLKYLTYNRQSKFAKHFLNYTETFKINTQKLEDYKDRFQEMTLGMNQKIFYVHQKESKFFHLVVKFEVGQDYYKSLEVITRYLKEVGSLKNPKEKWLQMMSLMGCRHDIRLNGRYFEIHLEGLPEHFLKAVEMVNELVVFHERDQILLQKIVDQIEFERKHTKLTTDLLSDMVYQYLLHKSASSYKRRMTGKALEQLDVLNLRDTLRRVMAFPVSFHYIGKNELQQVHAAASRYFQLPKRSYPPAGRQVKKIALYKQSTVLFYNDPKAIQTHIHFYVPGALLSLDSLPTLEAFNQYFGKDEQSLLSQNVIEAKGLARKAQANYEMRTNVGYRGIFTAHLICDPKKTTQLIKETLNLIRNLPLDSVRIPGLKSTLINSCFVNEHDVQNFTQEIERWRIMGYEGHPANEKIHHYQELNMQRLQQFFKVHLKGKPIAIAIVGNKKFFKPEELKNFGKIQYLKITDLVTY